jgi:hypothetical protein
MLDRMNFLISTICLHTTLSEIEPSEPREIPTSSDPAFLAT